MYDFILTLIIGIFTIILITRLINFFIIKRHLKIYSLTGPDWQKWLDKKFWQMKKRKRK